MTVSDRVITLDDAVKIYPISMQQARFLARTKQAPFSHAIRCGKRYMVPFFSFCRDIGVSPEDVDINQLNRSAASATAAAESIVGE